MPYGTNSSADTLASSQQSIAAYGEDRAWEGISADLEAHNSIVMDMMGDLVEVTTDRQRRYGGGGGMSMDEVDEFGRGDSQKVTAGTTVGFPLRLFDVTVGWTRKFMQNATVAQLNAQFADARRAHRRRIEREIKRAIFTGTNATFTDRLVDSVALPLKAFVNADSAAIPVGPNGETFTASTHTHYLYTAGTSLAAADVTALIATVVEHVAIGKAVVEINAAQEAAVRALTGFTPITPVGFAPANNALAVVGNLDRMNINNRLIGYFGNNYAEVWVKPWIPAGYLFAFVQGAPKPLCLRERSVGSSGLVVAAEDENYPLRAQTLEAELGVSSWNRTNGACLFVDAGAAGVYTAPTIT